MAAEEGGTDLGCQFQEWYTRVGGYSCKETAQLGAKCFNEFSTNDVRLIAKPSPHTLCFIALPEQQLERERERERERNCIILGNGSRISLAIVSFPDHL